jgi:hypothetical protein
MKYIKEFADIKENGYVPLSRDEYRQSFRDKLDFSDNEFESVKTIFPIAKYTNDDKKIIIVSDIRIHKVGDEYYYVSYVNDVVIYRWKCDQMYGLLNCLNMLKNKYYK